MKRLVEKKSKNIGLMGHVIADFPNRADALAMIDTLVNAGVDLIEIQIPFSEPMADGPLFMKANHQALAQGVKLKDCMSLMAEVSKKYDIPFVFMTYGNILYNRGFQKFCEEARACGAQGMIVPDLPVDMCPELEEACEANDLCNILVIPPNVDGERLKFLCKHARGLIYAVARAGVTGKSTEFGANVAAFLKRIRSHSDLPIAVGFGVASSDDVKFLEQAGADMAIIGSKSLAVFSDSGIAGLKKFWDSVRE